MFQNKNSRQDAKTPRRKEKFIAALREIRKPSGGKIASGHNNLIRRFLQIAKNSNHE